MNIERFRYFLEVSKTGSISEAAKHCNISQTGMSQQMDALENELGVKLLVRTKRGTSLTKAGEQLRPKAEKLLDDYQEIVDFMKDYSDNADSMIIAYTGPMEQQLLLLAIPMFNKLFPHVNLELRQFPMNEIGKALQRGQCDIALAIPQEISIKGAKQFCIYKQHIAAALPVNSTLSTKRKLSLQQLKDNKVILLKDESCVNASNEIKEWLLQLGWHQDQIIYADTIENQLLMVSLGQGITFVPKGKYYNGIKIVDLKEELYHYTYAYIRENSKIKQEMIKCLRTVSPTL